MQNSYSANTKPIELFDEKESYVMTYKFNFHEPNIRDTLYWELEIKDNIWRLSSRLDYLKKLVSSGGTIVD